MFHNFYLNSRARFYLFVLLCLIPKHFYAQEAAPETQSIVATPITTMTPKEFIKLMDSKQKGETQTQGQKDITEVILSELNKIQQVYTGQADPFEIDPNYDPFTQELDHAKANITFAPETKTFHSNVNNYLMIFLADPSGKTNALKDTRLWQNYFEHINLKSQCHYYGSTYPVGPQFTILSSTDEHGNLKINSFGITAGPSNEIKTNPDTNGLYIPDPVFGVRMLGLGGPILDPGNFSRKYSRELIETKGNDVLPQISEDGKIVSYLLKTDGGYNQNSIGMLPPYYNGFVDLDGDEKLDFVAMPQSLKLSNPATSIVFSKDTGLKLLEIDNGVRCHARPKCLKNESSGCLGPVYTEAAHLSNTIRQSFKKSYIKYLTHFRYVSIAKAKDKIKNDFKYNLIDEATLTKIVDKNIARGLHLDDAGLEGKPLDETGITNAVNWYFEKYKNGDECAFQFTLNANREIKPNLENYLLLTASLEQRQNFTAQIYSPQKNEEMAQYFQNLSDQHSKGTRKNLLDKQVRRYLNTPNDQEKNDPTFNIPYHPLSESELSYLENSKVDVLNTFYEFLNRFYKDHLGIAACRNQIESLENLIRSLGGTPLKSRIWETPSSFSQADNIEENLTHSIPATEIVAPIFQHTPKNAPIFTPKLQKAPPPPAAKPPKAIRPPNSIRFRNAF